jgi:hypothetical protein
MLAGLIRLRDASIHPALYDIRAASICIPAVHQDDRPRPAHGSQGRQPPGRVDPPVRSGGTRCPDLAVSAIRSAHHRVEHLAGPGDPLARIVWR